MRKRRDRVLAALLPLIARFAAAQTIPDIHDSLEPLTLPDETHALAFSIAAVVVLMLAFAIWRIWRARSRLRRNPIESPEARARRRLGLIECVTPRLFFTELHDVLVEYLEHRVVTEASRRTSSELVEVLDEIPGIQGDWRKSIADFLAKCDHARFSPSVIDCDPTPSVAECLNLISRLATLPTMSIAKRRRA